MKKLIWFGFFGSLMVLGSCSKEFKRDNPNDVNNPNGYKGAIAFSKATITNDYSDGNINTHNGQVNLYENIQFKVAIKNPGLKTITNVKAVMMEPSRGAESLTVDGTSPNGEVDLSFPDIDPGKVATCNELIDFKVSPDIQDNEKIIFTINLQDANGDNVTDTFSFKVYHFTPKYNFSLLQPQLLSSDQFDGAIRANAYIKVGLTIQNSTGYYAGNIGCDFTYSNSQIYNLSPNPLGFGPVGANSPSNQATIDILIQFGVPGGTNIPVSMKLTDDYGNSWPVSFYIPVVN